MKRIIYADNAATTRLDPEALDAMIPYLKDSYGNASQPYSFSREPRNALKLSRERIAECIGAMPEEIIFTSGGTESDNWAIKGLNSKTNSLTVITSCVEHHAVLNACKDIENRANIKILPVNEYGEVSCESLKKVLCELDTTASPVLVSVMMANNEIGTIQPIKDLSRVAHEYGAYFHTDAVQALGHIGVDVNDLDVDMLSASAHKFNGPKGIGFLYVKSGTPLLPFINGGSQERGMRSGTENIASIVGMSIALSKNVEYLEANTKKIEFLEKSLLRQLRESGLDFVRNGSNNRIPGNISLSFNECDGEMILHRMDLKGICISTGSACDSVNTQVSHVIKAIGLTNSYAEGTIRISLGKNNEPEEVDVIADELIKILS